MTPLIWFGPVWSGQVRSSVPEGYRLHVVGCVANVDPKHKRCTDEAAKWKSPDGRRLPGLRRALGLDHDARPVLAAFSAGGQCVRRLLLDPRDRAEIGGVYMADATYGEWESPGVVRVDELQEALVSFAVEAAADGRPLVMTGSSHVPGGGGPSASVTLQALHHEIELRGEGAFCKVPPTDPVLADLGSPVYAMRLRSVLYVDFGREVAHAGHATKLAPVLLPRILAA